VNRPDLIEIFTQIPLLHELSPDNFTITPLAGFSNQNYRLHNRHADWVLRIPKPRTNGFIDRAAEAHNQDQVRRLDLAPQVAWRSPSGLSLTPTISAGRSLARPDFTTEQMLQGIIAPIRRLHRSGLRFHGNTNLGELLDNHFDLLSASEQAPFLPRLRQARRLLALLETTDVEYVPSHRDLVLENLLFDERRLWLIDWEYSAMASPYWDLATLCNEAELDRVQSRRLLQVYCADGAEMKESLLFDYRGLLRLFSECWMAAFAD
jgi:thiamine kinase-like enzyme